MDKETYRAAFYVWSPESVRPLLESVFGYSDFDLDGGGKGAGARLNRGKSSFRAVDAAAEDSGRPQDAFSYLSVMRATHNRLEDIARAKGSSTPAGDAQRIMQKAAISAIASHPLKHIALVPPLYWQMMWVRTVPVWIAPIMPLMLFIGLIAGVVTGRLNIVAFVLLPLGIMALYLLSSHALPRYSDPLVPSMIAAGVTFLWLAMARTRFRRNSVGIPR